jgi:hypothetical protein
MDIIFFMVAGATVLFCFGVLVGSGLNTRCVDRRCRRAARLVQHLNESDAVMNGKPAKYRASPAHNQATAQRSASAEKYTVDDTAPHRGELGSAAQPR